MINIGKNNIKKTQDEYVNELKEKNPSIEVIGQYDGASVKILHKCLVCGHEWEVKPTHVLSGHGCPNCYSLNRNMTEEEFKNKLAYKVPYAEIEQFDRYNTNVIVKCLLCNKSWTSNKHHLLNGKGCPNCRNKRISDNNRMPESDFIERIHYYNPHIIPLTEYQASSKPITLKCLDCGYIWTIKRTCGLLQGHGCPKCHLHKQEKRISSFLKENNIVYKEQVKFDDLVGINGGQLSYDFYIPSKNLLVEYQGKQHYEPIDYFGGQERYEYQKEHDKRKKNMPKIIIITS